MLKDLSTEELAEFSANHGGNSELRDPDGYIVEDAGSLSTVLDDDLAFARSAA